MEKVLIIENNAMMRLFLSNYLSTNYEVLAVESPKQALGVNSQEFSLVLSDYHAPESEAYQALKKLQTSMAWQGIPMVVLTDEHKSEQRITAFKLGAQDCLSKPFNPVELSLRLQTLVAQKETKMVYRPVAQAVDSVLCVMDLVQVELGRPRLLRQMGVLYYHLSSAITGVF